MKNQSKKHRYGYYMVLCILLGGIFMALKQNIKPHSLSILPSFLVGFIGGLLDLGVVYFLIRWIIDLMRYRGGTERPENEKLIIIINIIFIIFFLLELFAITRLLFGF